MWLTLVVLVWVCFGAYLAGIVGMGAHLARACEGPFYRWLVLALGGGAGVFLFGFLSGKFL